MHFTVGEGQLVGEENALALGRHGFRKLSTAPRPPLLGVVVARLGEQVKDARGTAILSRPHVLADRLRVEHATLALSEQNERKHLPLVVRAYRRVDDRPVADGVDNPGCCLLYTSPS